MKKHSKKEHLLVGNMNSANCKDACDVDHQINCPCHGNEQISAGNQVTGDLINIDMNKFGIAMSVNISKFDLTKLIKDLKRPNNYFYSEGIDMKHFYADLQTILRNEDAFFDANSELIGDANTRWKSFGGDCILLAALDVAIYGNPITINESDEQRNSIGLWVYEDSEDLNSSLIANPTTIH